MSEEMLNEIPQTSKMPEQPIGQTPPQNPLFLNRKILIIVGIVFTLVLLIITGIVIFLFNAEKKNLQPATTTPDSIPIATPTPSPEEALRAPELYPEFDWIEVDKNDPYSMQSNLSDDPFLYLDSDPVYVPISGKEWSYSTELNSLDKLHELRQGFDAHYGREINRLGWDNTFKYNDKSVQALVADSPSGGIIGYIKIAGDKMRLVMLEDNTAYRGKSTNERPFSCPCEIDFKVFVSDIFSTSEMEK